MNTIVKSFEDLDVYQLSYKLALSIHKKSFALADQIRRASKSVCANIAEGFARQRASSPEFHRFLMMAIGSCDEMKVWISFCKDLGYVDELDANKYRDSYIKTARMLHGLRSKWK
jgi:four helix bundle protein